MSFYASKFLQCVLALDALGELYFVIVTLLAPFHTNRALMSYVKMSDKMAVFILIRACSVRADISQYAMIL